MSRNGIRALAALALLSLGGVASATTVLVNENVFVEGGSAGTTDLYAPQAGVLSVTLTDEGFPSPFASLQFGLGAGDATVGALSNAGTMTLDLTAPTDVYAHVFWETQNGSGLYNLTADFQPSSAVPLPSSALSLASGALLLLMLWFGADRLMPKRPEACVDATVTGGVV